jgi:hypothetical protein
MASALTRPLSTTTAHASITPSTGSQILTWRTIARRATSLRRPEAALRRATAE